MYTFYFLQYDRKYVPVIGIYSKGLGNIFFVFFVT